MMNPYTSYQQNQILESSVEDILLQLVQGALVRAKQAQYLWNNEEKTRARERCLQCMNIVCYLDETLDRENGGPIVEELEALYAYMIREITRATLQDNMNNLTPVQDVLHTLYQGWKDAVDEYKAGRMKHVEGEVHAAALAG